MQITLIENEIKAAIKLYLEQNIGLNHEMDIAVDFTATRGSEGLKASIDVISKDAPKETKPKITHVEAETVVDISTGEILPPEPEIKEVKTEVKPAKSLFANLTV